MLSNVKNPIYLPRHATTGFSFPAGTGLVVEQNTIVTRTGALVANGTLNTLVDGIAGTGTGLANNNEYFTLITDEIAVVKVQQGQVITYNAPIAAANTGTGRARVGVPGTDQIIGKALDTSDGSGTALAPHYIRVHLYL
jgi:hypothetical protein